jgi:zinc/manganese transport system permease protein
MFEYDFMINAFSAAGIVALVSGLVGYFLVMRGQTFAGHALSHIGFAGATGAGLIGLSPLWGLVGLTLVAGLGMGLLGERLSGRDVAIGIVLSLALGFGLLFLHYYTSFATQATAVLFGNVLAVDHPTIVVLAGLSAIILVAVSILMRPLVFASLQPELAEAKGVSLRCISMAFLAVVGLAVSACAQIVGVLMVFTLMGRAARRSPAGRDRVAGGFGSRGDARPDVCLARAHARLLYGWAGQLLHRAAERLRLLVVVSRATTASPGGGDDAGGPRALEQPARRALSD